MKYFRRTRSSSKIKSDYRLTLEIIIKKMTKSVIYWSLAQYRQNKKNKRTPKEILNNLNEVEDRWQREFTNLALRVSPKFARSVDNHTTSYLNRSLAAAKLQKVKFTLTDEMHNAIGGIIETNVNLIKSIPSHYFTQVKTITLESVTRGRDLAFMTEELQKQTGITLRRAQFIAIDQNNKASAQLSKIRQQSIGITKGVWLHSHGGSKPRTSHLAANGKEFLLEDGLPIGDDGEFILPGTIYNCGCSWKPISPYQTK